MEHLATHVRSNLTETVRLCAVSLPLSLSQYKKIIQFPLAALYTAEAQAHAGAYKSPYMSTLRK